jgi:hypothetical protein
VLGSGFSRSLGGPLLKDLFSERGREWTRLHFRDTDLPIGGSGSPRDKLQPVYDLFQQWVIGSTRQKRRGSLWNDAEDFLEVLALAQTTDSAGAYAAKQIDRLARSSNLSVGVLYERARRAIAAECLFTMTTSTEFERWGPYKRWAARLSPDDTLVTFNWDLVLEMLGTVNGMQTMGCETVVLPSDYDFDESQQRTDLCTILKMHGSVDWFEGCQPYDSLDDGETFSDLAMRRLKEGKVPIVGMPGPDKARLSSAQFARIWRRACMALELADVVVFLGYRFPPSDPQALGHVLGALSANKRPYLRVHTVLGPRTRDDDTVRLEQLLHHALNGSPLTRYHVRDETRDLDAKAFSTSPLWYTIKVQPLYVQDFLSVMHERELFGPDRDR